MYNYDDKDADAIRRIEAVVKAHDELDKQCQALNALFRGDYDAPVYRAIWQVFDKYADAVSELVGDIDYPQSGTWLSWYIHENDCGRKALAASVSPGRLRRIKNARDLVRLIRASTLVGSEAHDAPVRNKRKKV